MATGKIHHFDADWYTLQSLSLEAQEVIRYLIRSTASREYVKNNCQVTSEQWDLRAARQTNVTIVSSRGPKFPKPKPGTVPQVIMPSDLIGD